MMTATQTATDVITSRRSSCDVCGRIGVHVDTTAGEITEHGEVVAVAMLAPWLLCGRADGSELSRLFCERCAEIYGV
jgi:hypothetical protein